jgi:hypothetical protein
MTVTWWNARNSNKDIIPIENAKREIYFCIECKVEMIPKMGEIRQWHFAHKNIGECTGESSKHIRVKEYTAKILTHMLPNSNIGIEKKVNKYIPDINIDKKFAIEIVNSNHPSQDKLDFFGDKLIIINIKDLTNDDLSDIYKLAAIITAELGNISLLQTNITRSKKLSKKELLLKGKENEIKELNKSLRKLKSKNIKEQVNISAGKYSKYQDRWVAQIYNIGIQTSPESCVGDFAAMSKSKGSCDVIILGNYIKQVFDSYTMLTPYLFEIEDKVNWGWKNT